MSKIQNVKNVPAKKKRRKFIRTPSHILRIVLVWCFVICIFLLSFSFFNVTLYITKDLKVTPVLEQGDFVYSTQEEIDSACKNLQSAIDNLEKKPSEKKSKEENSSAEASANQNSSTDTNFSSDMNPMRMEWTYHILNNVQIDDIVLLIDKAKGIDENLYTEETVAELNKSTLKAQQSLGASVTISQNAFQLIFGGSIAEMYGYSDASKSIADSFLTYALAIMPVVGFFAASFDKKRHIKHIISMLCAVLTIADILFIIYPYVDIGSIFTIFMNIFVCVISVFSIYAKQQEDYIIKHPELEAEYGEKHPHFVKALVNYKSYSTVDIPTKADKEREAAKNAKRHNKKR